MTTYTLKLVSGVNYNLYNGATLVSDSDLATLFGSAGSAFFVFDFDGGTPTNTTSLTIVDSNSQAVITNTGLTGIAENTNFNGEWSASATAFDTFVKSPAAVLDEAQMSDLMGEIKERPIVGSTLSTPSNVAYVATANIQDGAVTPAKASFTTYSTTEQVVGTWIDGKPLYRRVIYGGFGTVTEGTQSEITLTISGADFGLVKDYWVDRSASGAINQGYASGVIFQGYTDLSGGNCGFKFRTTSAYISNTTVYAIVEYTKSAD